MKNPIECYQRNTPALNTFKAVVRHQPKIYSHGDRY